MRIIVCGASGKCGAEFFRLAVANGHAVTAIARPTTAYQAPEEVNVALGDVLDPAFVARIVPGHDAVMSGRGMRYRHPWASRQSPDDFTSRGTRHIVDGMRIAGIRRISVISAAGVADSRRLANAVIQLLVATSNVGYAYADLERVEQILKDSDLDWQAVRPTTLSSRRGTGRVRVTGRYPMTASIPRQDVAAFMLRELESGRFTARTPVITAG